MSPDELKEQIKSSGGGDGDDKRYEEYLDLMCNPHKDRFAEFEKKLDEDNSKMSPEEYADYLDVTLSLSMGICPCCQSSVFSEPCGSSVTVRSFTCTRFAVHSWIRSVPLMTDRFDLENLE